MSVRLTLATSAGLCIPETGIIGVFGVTPDFDLSSLPRDRVELILRHKPDFDHFDEQGWRVVTESSQRYATAVVALPRAKSAAQAVIWHALDQTDGPIVVDGLKSDGIDSILKAVRTKVDVFGPVSKAHGKLFWFNATPDMFDAWRPMQTTLDNGMVTAPGCFSADGPDPASVLLLESLPEKLGKRCADLGAGWGYLAAHILKREGVQVLHLIEADFSALECAQQNVPDSRAQFHWADARSWEPEERLDAVIMNPPFHTGRTAEPGLGQAFIAAAAGALTPHGTLWMVANRHLPYETSIASHFRNWQEITSDNRFKVLRATRPSRHRR